MELSDLTEAQRLQLMFRRAELKQWALSYALNPNDSERETMLLCAAHEFGRTLFAIDLEDHWRIHDKATPPCRCE